MLFILKSQLFLIIVIHHQHPASTSSPRLRFPHSMTWQRFNTWQRCCSASKRFTNASDPGASRLAAAWDNESTHQKHCINFIIFQNSPKYVNSKHVKIYSRPKLTRSLRLSVSASFSSFHPISIRCTNVSCSTRQLCSCAIPNCPIPCTLEPAVISHLPPRIHQFLSSFLWSLLFLHGLMKVSQAGVKPLVLWQKPTFKRTICKQHEPEGRAYE